MKKTIFIFAPVTLFFVVWLGIPTFNKWRADKFVDELCAKDGGITIYETVSLPKEQFNQWGQFEVRGQKHMMPGDEYYFDHETTDLQGKSASSNISALAIFKQHFKIFRIEEKKLLGEVIIYARTGGDPISPSHPSSYACPSNSIFNELIAKIFLKSTELNPKGEK